MEKIKLFKNKGEVFECQFDIDGVSPEDIVVRLCLEFDNTNLYFNGSVDKNGKCSIKVPKLDIDEENGHLVVEAIADSNYFKLYECDVILKKSVDIKMNENNSFFTNRKTESTDTKIQLADIQVNKPEIKTENANPYVPKEKKNPYIPSKFKSYLDKKK